MRVLLLAAYTSLIVIILPLTLSDEMLVGIKKHVTSAIYHLFNVQSFIHAFTVTGLFVYNLEIIFV